MKYFLITLLFSFFLILPAEASTVFFDGAESSNVWTTHTTQKWQITTSDPYQGSQSYFAPDTASVIYGGKVALSSHVYDHTISFYAKKIEYTPWSQSSLNIGIGTSTLNCFRSVSVAFDNTWRKYDLIYLSELNSYELYIDNEYINIASTSDNCSLGGDTLFMYNSNSHQGVYLDQITVYDSYMSPANYSSSFQWYYPQQDYIVSNDSFNDWAVYYDLSDSVDYDYLKLKIFSQDNYGLYLNEDFISTSTELTYWTVERTQDYYSGIVGAWGAIIGTNLENCTDINDYDCIWYEVDELDYITFTATSSGYSIYDYGTIGFFPSTSSLSNIFGSSTEEYSFVGQILNNSLRALSVVFPFNIPIKIYEQWLSATPSGYGNEYSFITDEYDEEYNLTIDLPNSFFGSTTDFVAFGPSVLSPTSATDVFYSKIRTLSTFLLYIMFIIGIVWRGYALYHHKD